MLLFVNLLKRDFIEYKYRFNLQKLVQVHHIISLQWKNHINLKDYNVYSWNNLIFLSTKKGKNILNTTRRIHEGGHIKYNEYIKKQLDLEHDPYELAYKMRLSIIRNEEIPW